jgi:putative endonuclease
MAWGRHAEDLAHRYLRARGLQVVARNYRPRGGAGEIDLVCRDGEILVFVEVKSRQSGEFGSPDRAIDEAKRNALIRSASDYVRKLGLSWDLVRFDVVNVIFGETPCISHVEAAFPALRAL